MLTRHYRWMMRHGWWLAAALVLGCGAENQPAPAAAGGAGEARAMNPATGAGAPASSGRGGAAGAAGRAGAGAVAGSGATDAGRGGASGAGSGSAADGGEGGAASPAGRDDDAGTPDRPAADSCKRGIGYGFDPASAPEDLAALAPGVKWFYGWAPAPSPAVAAQFERLGVEFVPMLWNDRFEVADVVRRIPRGAKYLLGFNEPNFHAQANLTPEQAAAAWPRVEEVAKQRNLSLVSPAVNFCGGGCNVTDPVEWLDRFFAACRDCKVDHIAVHWYACDESALDWYLEKFEKYGRPLWLTEFSCGDRGVQPVERQRAYMTHALAYLEASPEVFRYAWFSARTTAIANVDLLDSAGALSSLGETYVTLPQPSCNLRR